MKIKIFALTHKKFEVPQDKMYQPLQVGREEKEDLGYLCDNTGDNISAENCYYSELTGLYWIWKNVHTYKYVGTCHYRRYLLNEQEKIFTEAEYLELLKDYDLITTKRVVLNNFFLRCRSGSVWKMERTIITNGCLDLFPSSCCLCGCA